MKNSIYHITMIDLLWMLIPVTSLMNGKTQLSLSPMSRQLLRKSIR